MKVQQKSQEAKDRALAVHQRVSTEAAELLRPYQVAIRSDLVAESNRIEGYDWNSHQVRELVATHKELVSGPIGTFINSLRGDIRVYQALGLYRAHELADEWATTDRRPREFEIRGLHGIITAGENY